MLALIAPPAGRLLHDEIERGRHDRELRGPTLARLESLEQENALLRQQLRTVAGDRQLISRWDSHYSPRSVRALPVSDTSPTRHAFWIAAEDGLPLERDFAVVCRGALVGRVRETFPAAAIGVVQSLLDPGFVVRFKVENRTGPAGSDPPVWGILRGSGLSDRETRRPLLDVELIGSSASLTTGLQVFTDGGDGIYPRDILIGELVPSERPGEPGKLQVRAHVATRGLSDLVVLVDRQVATARSLSASGLRDGRP